MPNLTFLIKVNIKLKKVSKITTERQMINATTFPVSLIAMLQFRTANQTVKLNTCSLPARHVHGSHEN